DFVFATRLEGAVVRNDVLRCGILEDGDRRRFVEAGPARIRVHRQRRHERAMPDASFENFCGCAHAAGNVAAQVDRGIPFTLLERRQPRGNARVAIADEMLDLAVSRDWLDAAREDRNVVAARERGVDQMPAEKTRAAENEELHVGAARVLPGNAAVASGTRVPVAPAICAARSRRRRASPAPRRATPRTCRRIPAGWQ